MKGKPCYCALRQLCPLIPRVYRYFPQKMDPMTGNCPGGGLGPFTCTHKAPWQQGGCQWDKLPAGSGLQGQPSPGNCWLWGESIPLCNHAGLFLVFCHLLLSSGTENSGNKIPSPESRPIQLQIPFCLCQQCTPNAEVERVAASKSLLLFPLNSPSDSSFRMKLLTLSLSPKDLFRSC